MKYQHLVTSLVRDIVPYLRGVSVPMCSFYSLCYKIIGRENFAIFGTICCCNCRREASLVRRKTTSKRICRDCQISHLQREQRQLQRKHEANVNVQLHVYAKITGPLQCEHFFFRVEVWEQLCFFVCLFFLPTVFLSPSSRARSDAQLRLSEPPTPKK